MLIVDAKAMLRILRAENGQVVFSLIGRIEAVDVVELERLLSLEAAGREIVLDLREITLIDRDGVKFLDRCKTQGIKLENCPAYIREWIDSERGTAKKRSE